MNKKLMAIGMIALTVLILAGAACSRHAFLKPFDGDAVNPAFVYNVTDKVVRRLQLNPQQRELCTKAVQTMANTALAQRSESGALRERLAMELGKDTPDWKAVEALTTRKAELFKLVMDSGWAELIALHATLSPSQRAALAQLILDHGGEGGPHHPW